MTKAKRFLRRQASGLQDDYKQRSQTRERYTLVGTDSQFQCIEQTLAGKHLPIQHTVLHVFCNVVDLHDEHKLQLDFNHQSKQQFENRDLGSTRSRILIWSDVGTEGTDWRQCHSGFSSPGMRHSLALYLRASKTGDEQYVEVRFCRQAA